MWLVNSSCDVFLIEIIILDDMYYTADIFIKPEYIRVNKWKFIKILQEIRLWNILNFNNKK